LANARHRDLLLKTSEMRKTHLHTITDPKPGSIYTRDKRYWIWLGNGVKCSFTNKKHAVSFLANLSKLVNEKLFELNLIYIDIFAEYRRLWFYFDVEQLRQSPDEQLHYINKNFDMMANNHRQQSNIDAFNRLRNLIDDLKAFTQLVIEVAIKKNDHAVKNFLNVHLCRMDAMKAGIEAFRQNINEEYFKY
jgi:hypothetical protein